jgi:ankyrin repeat protein
MGLRKIVQTPLKVGANVNAQGGRYGTALQASASMRDTEIVQLLVDQGANVNGEGGQYGTAL